MRLLWAFEIAMEVGGSRSHSVPVGDRSGPGGLDVNPFYSEKAKDQCRLDAARPKELPAQEEEVLAGSFSSPELAIQSNVDGNPTGKGRGSASAGVMPRDETEVGIRVLKTEGKLPTVATGTNGEPETLVTGDGNGLQRALEVEMVDFLRQQNSKLQNEVAALKEKLEKSSGAGSSPWSRIDGIGSGSASDSQKHDRHVRNGSRTPRGAVREVAVSPERKTKRDSLKFTPNGTRVPDGPPPTASVSCLPPVPPLPVVENEQVGGSQRVGTSFDDGLYDTCESKPRVRNGDVQWKPHDEKGNDAILSPQEAKQAWLEREVRSLKVALDRVAVPSTLTESAYWNPSGGAGNAHGKDLRHLLPGSGDAAQQGRALRGAVHGEGAQQDRALHGTVLGDDALRGVAIGDGGAHHGRALHGTALGDLPGHDRALHGTALGDLPGHDRALHGTALGDLPGHDRALHGGAAEQLHGLPRDERLHGGAELHGLLRDGRLHGGGTMGVAPMPASWEASGGGSGGKAELPTLPNGASPLEFGDWLCLCGPIMKDLSHVAGRWWNATVRQAHAFYMEWKGLSPLQRVQLCPRLPDELMASCFIRTEQRGVTLLLKAVSDEQQRELVVDRDLTSTAILFRLYVRHQPGGPGEKAILLGQLTSLQKASTMQELASSLRTWRRYFARAREVDASLPDGVLLIKALEAAVVQIAKEDSQAAFRLSTSRQQLALDQRPTEQSIWSFSQCLLAEAETLSLLKSSSTTTASASTPVRLKQMDAEASNSPQKPGTPGNYGNKSGKGNSTPMSEQPCKFFKSDGGCKAGQKLQVVSQLGQHRGQEAVDAGYAAPRNTEGQNAASRVQWQQLQTFVQ